MIDKVTVIDPGWSWDGWWWTGAVIGVIFIVSFVAWLVSFASSTREGASSMRHIAFIALIVAAIAVPVGAGVNAAVSAIMRNNQIGEEKDRQIEELGYLNLEDESEYYQFTAVKDNQYVRLVIIEYPTLTWQIMTLDMNYEE